MNKPFLTIQQQVDLLASRGVAVDEHTPKILMNEGYYSVINGYKEPFLDVAASREAGDDRYLNDTSFADIYALFLFDRDLRELTFHYLTKIENLVRTLCAYRFSEAHPEKDAYLDYSNYTTKDDYLLGPKNFNNDLSRLIEDLRKKSEDKHGLHDYIKHYRNNHGYVPLWVLVNSLTFGNIEHLFDLMKPEEQKKICRDIAEATGRLGDKTTGFLNPRCVRINLETAVKFRNLCAHDERLYCAKVGSHKDVGYLELLRRMRPFLSEESFVELVNGLNELVNDYASQRETINHVLAKMGLDQLGK